MANQPESEDHSDEQKSKKPAGIIPFKLLFIILNHLFFFFQKILRLNNNVYRHGNR